MKFKKTSVELNMIAPKCRPNTIGCQITVERSAALSGCSVHYVPCFSIVPREEFCSTLLIITVDPEDSLPTPAVVYNVTLSNPVFENDQRNSVAFQPDLLRCQINSTKPCLFNCLKLTCLRRRHVAAVARRLIESSFENTCSKISTGRSVSFNASVSVDGRHDWVWSIFTPMASVQVK
ncbi:hypothetical protein T05_1264 [Trichinella murrelli]|uniref:Uncharacterized protein n=1 Tax=Trichinella murrelli TaxID=144512 RepID=A0A0V0UCY4_9BILA|nr:hypothetical protein T05_1264 [Trichinella murrelli]